MTEIPDGKVEACALAECHGYWRRFDDAARDRGCEHACDGCKEVARRVLTAAARWDADHDVFQRARVAATSGAAGA